MHAFFLPISDYQWVRFKINLELKYLHLAFRLYANRALFKYAEYWYTIELKAPSAFYLTIYLPLDKHQICKRDLYEQIANIQLEYNNQKYTNEHIPEFDLLVTKESENDSAGIVTVISMADIPFEYKMSQTIIQCLKNETVDHDAILGLAVYMHLILIKHASSLLNISSTESCNRFYDIYNEEQSSNKELVRKKYNENEHVLNQITEEVFSQEEPAADSWNNPIHDLFIMEMHSRRFALNSLDIPGFKLWKYPYRINLILGLSHDDIQMIYYFIMKSLNFSNG